MLTCALALGACGTPNDAELAAQQQAALAASVVAGDTITNLATTSAAMTTTAVAEPDATSANTTATAELQAQPTVERATAAPTSGSAAQAPTSAPSDATAEVVPIGQAPTAPPANPTPKAVARASEAATTPESQALPTRAIAEPATPVPPSPIPPSPEPATAVPVAAQPVPGTRASLSFAELYSGASIMGPQLSEKASQLNGQQVVMLGYMAPPLKPDLDFFVLTKDPMVYCPFCSTATDWPFDIVFVRMASGTVPPIVPTSGIRVYGTFETGTATDAATGFVSQVRIIADKVEAIE